MIFSALLKSKYKWKQTSKWFQNFNSEKAIDFKCGTCVFWPYCVGHSENQLINYVSESLISIEVINSILSKCIQNELNGDFISLQKPSILFFLISSPMLFRT